MKVRSFRPLGGAPDAAPQITVARVGLLAAFVGAIAGVFTAATTGLFSRWAAQEQGMAQISLAQQKFNYDLILRTFDGLDDDVARACELHFWSIIGVLTGLKPDTLNTFIEAALNGETEGDCRRNLFPRGNSATQLGFDYLFPPESEAASYLLSEEAVDLMERAGILDTAPRAAAFLATLAGESARYQRMEENAMYSADRLQLFFPSRYTDRALAEADSGNPEAILNRLYGDRMGNTQPGDGWLFRGRGYVALTGRDAYRKAGQGIGLDVEENPDLAADPAVALRIAIWFFNDRSLFEWTDAGDFIGLRRAITGGSAGVADFTSLYNRLLLALTAPDAPSNPLTAALRNE